MSRALFITCALLAAAVVWFRATAADCEGWYCLAMGDKPVAQPEARFSAVPAGGRQIGGATAGSPGSEQAMFESPVSEDGPLDQAVAEPETERWSRPAQTRSASAFDGVAGGYPAASEDHEADTPARRIAAKKAARKAANAWEALVTTALEEPDPAKRGAAIGDLGLHRNDDAVVVLLEVATFEPDPDNRYQAVQSLWYSAADGLDRDGSIRSSLQAAARDPDEQIAEMAKRALEDLEALEKARATQ